MKRLFIIAAVLGLLPIAAFAQDAVQEGEQPDQAVEQTQAQPTPQGQLQQQIQGRIADLYLSSFREEVELTDEQVLKLSPDIRQFIQGSFRLANRRRVLNERQAQLLSQPNPSRTDVQMLNEQRARMETEAATLESRFLRRHEADLSERQMLLVSVFNRKFFNERLPRLLDQARAAAGNRGLRQQQPPGTAGRANRGQNPARDRVPARQDKTFGSSQQR